MANSSYRISMLKITNSQKTMSPYKVWASSEDGSLEYVSITKELLKPSIRAMQQSFYVNENVCVAFDMANQPEAFPDMDVLLLRAAKDGVSIAAIDKVTGKIAGAAFNKLEEPGESGDFYANHVKTCKHSASKGAVQWMLDTEKMFDVFDHCKVDSVMEVMFLGIVPAFRRRGIGKKLMEVSMEVARKLNQGHNVKVPVDDEHLELGNPPQLVSVICTTFITQRIAKKLNCVTAKRVPFDKFVYDGKSIASILGNHKLSVTYEYLRL